MSKKMVQVRIEESIRDDAKIAAAKAKVSLSIYVQSAVADSLFCDKIISPTIIDSILTKPAAKKGKGKCA